MLPYEHIESLAKRICPYCDNTVIFDYDTHTLFCECCGIHWDYGEYKACKEDYYENADVYLAKYNYEKLCK